MEQIRKILKKVTPEPVHNTWRLGLKTAGLLFSDRSWLRKNGYLHSFYIGRPVDGAGNPLPWMNYQTIYFLEERLKPDMRVFEYGAGFSTLFLAGRVREIAALEYDRTWHDQLSGMGLPGNARLIFREKDVDGAYCRTIQEQDGAFDLVIIDGRDRVNCLKQCLSKLSPGGVVLLDDSQRKRYEEAHPFMAAQGFRHLHFLGLKPQSYVRGHTTLFYRDGNAMGI